MSLQKIIMKHYRMRKRTRIIVLAAILPLGLVGPLWATPDPDIFDGSKYDRETKKRFALSKVIKNVRLGLPSLSDDGKSFQKGGHETATGRQGQGPGGQDPLIRQQRGPQQDRDDGPISGTDGEEIDPNAGGSALGGNLAEVDLDTIKEDFDSEAGNDAQSSSGLARRSSNITLGAKDQMIPIVERPSGDSDDINGSQGNSNRGEPSELMPKTKGPEMRGKNKGTSIGVETGQSIPADL